MRTYRELADILPLNTTFPPIADESLYGYLARLAEANDSRVGEVLDRADIRFQQSHFKDTDVHRIAKATRQTFEKLRNLAPNRHIDTTSIMGCQLDNLGVLIKTRRICPKCIKGDKGYYKAVWDWKFVQHCPDHKLRLVTHCPNKECGKALDWRTTSIRRCTCMADLTKAQAEKSEPADLHAIKVMLAIAYKDKAAIPPLLKGLDTWWAWLAITDFASLSLKTRKLIWPGGKDPALKATYGGNLTKKFIPVEVNPPRDNARRMSLGAVILSLPPEKLEQALMSEIPQLGDSEWSGGAMDLSWYGRIKRNGGYDKVPLVKLVDRVLKTLQ